MAAAGGFVSGFGLGGINQGGLAIQNRSYLNGVGQASNIDADSVKQIKAELDTNKDHYTDKEEYKKVKRLDNLLDEAIKTYNNGKDLSDYQKGSLEAAMNDVANIKDYSENGYDQNGKAVEPVGSNQNTKSVDEMVTDVDEESAKALDDVHFTDVILPYGRNGENEQLGDLTGKQIREIAEQFSDMKVTGIEYEEYEGRLTYTFADGSELPILAKAPVDSETDTISEEAPKTLVKPAETNEPAKALAAPGLNTNDNEAISLISDSDLEDYINAGKNKSLHKRNAIDKGKEIVIKSKEGIVNYIKRAIKGEKQNTAAYAKVGDRLANEIYEKSNGKVDVHGYFMELVSDNIRHAYNGHKNAKMEGDIDLSDEDFYKLYDYIESYDEVSAVKEYGNGNTTIEILSRKKDGGLFIVQVVSKKSGALQFKNCWGLGEDLYNKKGSGQIREEANASESRPDATSFENSIPQTETNSQSEVKTLAAPDYTEQVKTLKAPGKGENNGESSSTGQKRQNVLDRRGEGSGVREGTETGDIFGEEGRNQAEISKLNSGRKVSAVELGIKNGTLNKKATLLDESSYMEAETPMAKRLQKIVDEAEQNGVSVSFITGTLEPKNKDGNIYDVKTWDYYSAIFKVGKDLYEGNINVKNTIY